MKTINNKWLPQSRIDPKIIYNVEWSTGNGNKTKAFLDYSKAVQYAKKKANQWDVVSFETFNIQTTGRKKVDFLSGVSE